MKGKIMPLFNSNNTILFSIAITVFLFLFLLSFGFWHQSENATKLFLNPVLGIVFFLAMTITTSFFAKKFGFLRGTLFSFSLFVATAQLFAIFGYFGIAQFPLLFWLVFAIVFFVAFILLPKAKPEQKECFGKAAFFAFVAFAAFTVFLQLFLPSHFWPWNVFYERQTSLFIQAKGLPTIDPFSYLGRGISFAQGYSFFESALFSLSGISFDALFAASLFFSNLLLVFSAIFFAKNIGFSPKKSIAFLLLLFSLTFIFNNFFISPRHTLSFALMLFALALFLEKNSFREWVFASFIFATAFFIQIPTIVFSAILAFFFFNIGKDWKSFFYKKTLVVFGFALAIFAFLYSKTFLQFGLPLTSKASDWGYLISVPTDWFLHDLNAFSFLFVFSIIAGIFLLFLSRLNSFEKKIFFGLCFSAILEFAVTFRFNLVTQVFFSAFCVILLFGLLPKTIPKIWSFKTKQIAAIVFLLFFLFSLQQNILNEFSTVFSKADLEAFALVEKLTPSDAKILADPNYGHALEFFGKRKVLADLYTENADTKKLDAAFAFLSSADTNILCEYEISFVFVDRAGYWLDAKTFVTFDSKGFGLEKVFSISKFDFYYFPGCQKKA